MNLQNETVHAYQHLRKIAYQSQSFHAMRQGRLRGEPLFISLDGAIRYAKAYKARFEQPLKDDGVLGPAFLQWINGVRELLNGDGALAMEMGWTTDSKDNGTLEHMFWDALKIAGFSEEDL